VIAWSGEIPDASINSEPSDSILTLGAVSPRITGLLAPAPKVSAWTPNIPLRVSPRVASRRRTKAEPSSVWTGVVMEFLPTPNGLAETVIASSTRGHNNSGVDRGEAGLKMNAYAQVK